jgi:hypothetical protein
MRRENRRGEEALQSHRKYEKGNREKGYMVHTAGTLR